MYVDKEVIAAANAVADALQEEFYEAMMAHGEAMEFVVARSPGSGYVQISIGYFKIWDTEDDNNGNDQTFQEIMEHCRERLNDLADMFSVFSDARYQTVKKDVSKETVARESPVTDDDKKLMVEQIILHTMIGANAGLIARSAMTNPAEFYIDDRAGRLRYPRKEIYKQAAKLAKLAVEYGQNPRDLPVLW